MRHALYLIPRHPGVASTAANFLLHADGLMSVHSAWNLASRLKGAREFITSAINQTQSSQESKP
jgi:hypothetical protein